MLRIGSLVLPGDMLLAPMAGTSDAAFRPLCLQQGAAMAVTEMVSAKGMLYGSERTNAIWQRAEGEAIWCVQLFGRDIDAMVRAAHVLEEAGVHIIDINMGCPAPKITSNGEGAALMQDAAQAEKIVGALVRAVRLPITVKLRKGWSEGQDDFLFFGRRMADAGAAALALHGRYRSQFYAGKADWGAIAALKSAVRVPVIGNGDVFTAEDALAMKRETHCDGVMIARGAQGNPWIFAHVEALRAGQEAAPPSVQARAEMALRHARALVALKGEYTAVREMRRHLACYGKGLAGAAAMRGRLLSLSSMEEIKAFLASYPQTV